MSSLVSEFLINPVLRQARRFSRSDRPVHTRNSNYPLTPHLVPESNNEVDEVVIEGVIEGETAMDLPDSREYVGVDNLTRSLSNSSTTHEDGGNSSDHIQSLRHEVDRNLIDSLAPSHIQSSMSQADSYMSDNPPSDIASQTQGNIIEGTSGNAALNVLDLHRSPAEGSSQHSSQNSTSASMNLDMGSSALPADDGMGPLRQRIKYIQAMDTPTEQKALLMHQLLTQGYTEAHEIFNAKNYVPTTASDKMISQERPATPGSLSSFIWQMNGTLDPAPATESHTFHLSPDDLKRTYAPFDPPEVDDGSEESENTEDFIPKLGKSVVGMETQFRNMDRAIDHQPMPPQFRNTLAMVSCNDCYAKSAVKYHWLGLKCAICDSYNTAQLSILSDPEVETPAIGTGDTQNDRSTSQEPREMSSSTHLIPGIPRNRRHSSHVPSSSSQGESGRFSPYPIPFRLGRSVSPARGLGIFGNQPVAGGESDASGDEDDLDFWGRDEPRNARESQATHEADAQVDNDIEYEYDSSDSESGNDDDDDDDDGEEEPFAIFGHR
ncbi:hypothetical protein SBOR_7946 [Sclerotinia borealis F-4128]|uniref:RCHY1 zinc-ribbon domain-containing protein n=1 Tax=Sclerotinia borealis (strain F-4128) TaxID=1432307 RepID=W9C9Z6_SCLBF|nr:hypothetical protein SBOR_7946 [Sclerotinia borealis F-4128]